MQPMSETTSFKSGFVAIVGRPNAGKSTLVNALVESKVSIVTPVPQTTRNRILGILHRPDAQVIFMDTPGVHKPLSRLNEQMMNYVRQALADRDLAVLIVDASEKYGKGDEFVINLLNEYSPRAILALNKVDRVHKPDLLPLMDRYSKLYGFEEIFPISALHGEGLDGLLDGHHRAAARRSAILSRRRIHRPAGTISGGRNYSRKGHPPHQARNALRDGGAD